MLRTCTTDQWREHRTLMASGSPALPPAVKLAPVADWPRDPRVVCRHCGEKFTPCAGRRRVCPECATTINTRNYWASRSGMRERVA